MSSGLVLARVSARRLLLVLFAMVLCACFTRPAHAQSVTWSEVDLAPTGGAAGSVSINTGVTPNTYTVNGSGAGLGFTDSMGFAYTSACGNIELKCELDSQSSTTAGAMAGITFRDSFDTGANMCAVAVSVGGDVSFSYRVRGSNIVTVNGPAVSAPVYLRLTNNSGVFTGYYSTDNETWTVISSYTSSAGFMQNLYYAGFLSSSTTTSLNASVFNFVTYATSVPQLSSNLLLWLRSDVGVVSAAGLVSQWTDQSSGGNNATQSTGAAKPTLTTGAINTGVLPTLIFGGSQWLSMPAGFSALNNGCSIFVVLKPSSSTATGDPCAFGNASNSDAIFAQTIGKNASLSVSNGTTSSTVTTTGTPLSTTNYQFLEETFSPGASANTGTGTIFVNGTQDAQSTTMVQNMNNISRADDYVGVGIGSANYFQGAIAEILVFASPLTASQRASLESYVVSKYSVGTQPTLDAPTFSPAPGVYAPGTTVSILQDQGAVPWFTTNGATPSVSVSSQWFDATPITVAPNETIKALAVAPYFNNSAIASASYLLDPLSLPVARSGLVLWLRPDYGLTVSSGKISSWLDASGSGNTATQGTSAKQPSVVTGAINGYSAASFNGTSSYLALPSGFANFTAGATILIVTKPAAVTAGARMIDLGNGASSDNLYIDEPTSTGASFYAYTGSTSSSVTSSSAITLNKYQLLELNDNGTGTATIFTNGVQGAQTTTINSLNNLIRSSSFIGQGSGSGNFFNGQIVELLLWNRGLTPSEQAYAEGYLFSKYQLGNANTVAAPTLSLSTSTLTAPQQVAIEAPAAAVIHFTSDGTTPTLSSPVYVAPLMVSFTQTVKAIAVINNLSSSVASATYTLDSTQWPPASSTTTPLQLNLQLPTVAVPQDANQH